MQTLPSLECTLTQAQVQTDGDRLIVSTGRIRRAWSWTGTGFATSEIAELSSGRTWRHEPNGCDWQLPDGAEPNDAVLLSLSAVVADDEGFTSEHIAVVAEINYPARQQAVRFTIWVYPDASGIRTQLHAHRTAACTESASDHQGRGRAARVERVPLEDRHFRRRLFGYYNETQQRNDTHQDILKDELIVHPLMGRETCSWASALCIEDDAGGLALVKESHKCVNQTGHASGDFICDESEGVSCTGWGLQANEIPSDGFAPAWATWCIVWSGGDLAREIAFKTFDRRRYPVDPKRDIYIQANTWGSSDSSPVARQAAGQQSVLEELDVCAEMGIDVLQIDDGWQVPYGNRSWDPGERGWHPHPDTYPNGWDTIRARARQLGVKLGLWAAATPISLEELKQTRTEGGFSQYKLDFASLRSHADIHELMRKVRAFITWSGHTVRVNWDVTENSPRYGYFFAREYGPVYLENRKPTHPLAVVYRPHTVLRDLWQIAKYLNLHRFQCSIQNVDQVDRSMSDAYLHSHAYATAIALMGIPLFFLETKFYSAEAKAEICPLLNTYKKHRNSIYRGIVHPIGDKPDNASWTGFQCHLTDENRGYLMVFRERCNAQSEQSLKLGWLSPGEITITDLVRNTTESKEVDNNNAVSFCIENAAQFLFLEYTQG